jgi:hypothetical protein
LQCEIGSGGGGTVYLANDARLPGKVWAVKELSDAAIADPVEKQEAIQRFLREAQLLAKLDHPNIPKVIDSFTHRGKHYLVMEYVDGRTLEALLSARGRPFTEVELRPWVVELCDALSYLHSCHPCIVFRDLKPQNIMLTRTGQIKLIDFGIARLLQPGKSQDTTLLGTSGYAAPEQYGKGQTDARSDIYALGATLLRLLTGYDPATTPFNLPPVRRLCPNVSPGIEQVVTRSLVQDPRGRWQSIADIQRILQSNVTGPRSSATAAPGASSAAAYAAAPQSSLPLMQSPPTLAAKRPTTRLLLAVAQLSDRQIAMGGMALLLLAVLGIWLLGPLVQRDLPFIWDTFPAFTIGAPLAYAATRRRGAALLGQTLIAFAGWAAWWLRSGDPRANYGMLLVASLISGCAAEAALYFLPRITAGTGDQAWKRELAWLAATSLLVGVVFFTILDNSLFGSRVAGWWIGALPLGALGWFLGDLVQQWVFLRQTGLPRKRRA